MENSLLFIFDKNWLETMYYSTGTLAQFWSNFKKFVKNPILIGISSKFLHNIHVYVSENVIKMKNSLLLKFGQRPCTIVQGLWPDF